MAISARFQADFSSFVAAVESAELKLKSFETGSGKVESALSRMANSFSGVKVQQEAALMTAAVEKLGGVSTLTESEQRKVNAVVTEAIAKYTALGQTAPKAMVDLANATKQVKEPTQTAVSALGGLEKIATSLGVAFSIGALVSFGKELLSDAGKIQDMSDRLGISTTAVQQFSAAARAGGAEMEDVAKAINKINIAVGNDNAKAFERLGLSFQAIQAMSPEDRLIAVASALAAIPDEAERAAAGNALLGKSYLQLAGAMKDLAGAQNLLITASPTAIRLLDATGDSAGGLWQSFKNLTTEVLGFVAAGGTASDWMVAIDKTNQMVIDSNKKLAAAVLGSKKATEEKTEAERQALDASRQMDEADKAAIDQQSKLKKAQDEAADAAKRYADHLHGLADSFRGLDVIAKAKDATLAFAIAQRQGLTISQMSREQIAALNKQMDEAIEVYSRTGKVAPQAMRDLYSATVAMPPVIDGLGASVKQLGEEIKIALPQDVLNLMAFDKARDGVRVIDGLGASWSKFGEDVKAPEIPKQLQQTSDVVKELAAGFVALGQIGGASFGPLMQDMGALFNQLHTGSAVFDQYKESVIKAYGATAGAAVKDFGIATPLFDKNATAADKWASGVASAGSIASGAMDVWTSTANAGSKAAGALHGAVSGAKAGAAFGPWGAAVGAGAGALVGFIRNMNAARSSVKDFANSMGGFDAVRQQLLVFGDAGEQAWKKLSGVKGGDKAAADAAIANIQTLLAGSTDKLNAMVNAAVTGGPQLEASMQPLIEQLIKTGKLTDENANLLLGLPAAGVPSIDQVKQAADRYGLSLDVLGPKVDQLQITAKADQIVKDWELLAAAGADTGAVMAGMTEQVQPLVDSALRFGRELPESMRDMLTQMAAAGDLTDLTGAKLMDLSSVNFATPIEKSIERLVTALEKLFNIKVDPITVPYTFTPTNTLPDGTDGGGGGSDSGGAAYGGPQAAGGDYMVSKPTWFLAGDGGPERATFTPAGKAGSGGSGSGVSITLNVDASGQDPQAIAQAIMSQLRTIKRLQVA